MARLIKLVSKAVQRSMSPIGDRPVTGTKKEQLEDGRRSSACIRLGQFRWNHSALHSALGRLRGHRRGCLVNSSIPSIYATRLAELYRNRAATTKLMRQAKFRLLSLAYNASLAPDDGFFRLPNASSSAGGIGSLPWKHSNTPFSTTAKTLAYWRLCPALTSTRYITPAVQDDIESQEALSYC
ncbi:uncharacterized protein K452DRAFT_306153 [Aplosporella prunicola CBS 121167]|uniref:Uncharacterized protein n=1 Tax=Aplosporella prunicola CBS 121167 TaxID=1176127 RepID=A0A6A6BMG5_9PEZI|nr:uncharacterized protein K452DRAFT_306153 [Aplosporella prunicola CBS 121167]KAF2145246.1 hypothetical protein K452DRAFT_306153 [Aplosporella prunicola CBS 121167]